MKKIFMFNKMLVGLMLMALAMLAQPVDEWGRCTLV